ncbi:phosphoglycolate phosphatase [Beggiatoa leptomitoformis]|uniref:Phosphoglycolate phosphatase n=1 Tax=Beggiatoa leptomitoformis TaxID=288004 RepID=A0A2N9YC33_9GAMM|nr:phosphoglycolate phosphatase [Beggiatoa leptomitoformis]ALG66653.1 phosphoglycolate phosphatase [Beggiatoa leptomitoformis]AUI68028.1 phosphoglycolate phosphatase [Beggiatoa leptomitoformis]
MMQRPALVLCDLDGTLVDSMADLANAVDAMMAELELPLCGEEKVRHWVGNGAERLVKRALTNDFHAEPDADLFAKAFPLFVTAYAQNNGEHSKLYDGVMEGLLWLQQQGFHLGCITNKPEQFTLPLLEKLDIKRFFPLVVSGDTLPAKKPDPLPLLHAAQFFGVLPADSLFIGDSINDVLAARAAGFSVICVSYGYNHGQDIRTANPDSVLDSLVELTTLSFN